MADDLNVQTDGLVDQVRSLVEEYVHPTIVEVSEPGSAVKAEVVIANGTVIPLGAAIFDPYREAPRRLKGTATLTSLDSFIAWTKRFADSESALFAIDNRENPSITAVINYSESRGWAGIVGEDTDGALGHSDVARFGDHRGHYVFPLSDEWKAWVQQNATTMSMVEFARFLEDRIIDIVDPETMGEMSADLQRYINAVTGGTGKIATPTALVGLSQGLKVNEISNVQQHANLSSGEAQIIFQTRHENPETGGPVSIPSMFLITIPIFNNGPAYRLAARLRYRIKEGRPVFYFELWRHDRAFDDAFNEAVQRASTETALPLYLGKPE